MPRGKRSSQTPRDLPTLTFNPGTMKFREVIETKIRQGKSQQQVYDELKATYGGKDRKEFHSRDKEGNTILGREGLRKSDVLDYSRFLRERIDAAKAIKASRAKTPPSNIIPLSHTLKNYDYSYTYGVVGGGREKFITVNSDRPLTNKEGKAKAESIARFSVHDSGGLGRDANITKIDLLYAVQRNPNADSVIAAQNERTAKYYAKRSERIRNANRKRK